MQTGDPSSVLSQARSRLAATTVGNLAIFAGGQLSTSTSSAIVDVYDLGRTAWGTPATTWRRRQWQAWRSSPSAWPRRRWTKRSKGRVLSHMKGEDYQDEKDPDMKKTMKKLHRWVASSPREACGLMVV